MLTNVIVNFIPIIIAIVAHELAHGYVANEFGDNTARRYGRLSLNPLRHVDWFGTIVLPAIFIVTKAGFIFGWAKPVPVDFSKLDSKWKYVAVAAAGILTNAYLAVVSALLLYLASFISVPSIQAVVRMFLLNMVVFNIILAIFNLLPLPPLDGSKILFGWINKPWAQRYVNAYREGLIALVLIGFVLPAIAYKFGYNLNILGMYLINVSKYFTSLLV